MLAFMPSLAQHHSLAEVNSVAEVRKVTDAVPNKVLAVSSLSGGNQGFKTTVTGQKTMHIKKQRCLSKSFILDANFQQKIKITLGLVNLAVWQNKFFEIILVTKFQNYHMSLHKDYYEKHHRVLRNGQNPARGLENMAGAFHV